MLLVLRDPLFQRQDIALEHGGLPQPLRVDLLAALGQKLQLVLHLLKLVKVLLLHVRELGLDNVELFFIFLARLPEPVRELPRLRVVKLSIVRLVRLLLSLCFLHNEDKLVPFDLGQLDLIVQSLLSLNCLVLVGKVVLRQLIV